MIARGAAFASGIAVVGALALTPPGVAAAQNPVPAQGIVPPAGPQFVNAVSRTQASSGSLPRDFEAVGASSPDAWITYRVAVVRGPRSSCGGRSHMSSRLQLEPAQSINVLIRLENRRPTRIETATPDCVVDAGGLPVVDLTGVAVAESARWLIATIEQVPATPGNSLAGDQALAALAWHDSPDALRALIRLARSGERPETRSRALFWVAQRAEREVDDVVKGAADNDPDTSVKRKAVFALTQLPPDRGIPMLIDVAKTSSNRDVRRQAMFWLGQSKDPRAVEFFESLLSAR